jgi:hypothetical protein
MGNLNQDNNQEVMVNLNNQEVMVNLNNQEATDNLNNQEVMANLNSQEAMANLNSQEATDNLNNQVANSNGVLLAKALRAKMSLNNTDNLNNKTKAMEVTVASSPSNNNPTKATVDMVNNPHHRTTKIRDMEAIISHPQTSELI